MELVSMPRKAELGYAGMDAARSVPMAFEEGGQ